ncbi:hypothetical protein ENUP19_0051G0043 [Entamoeba nuttalli]|uniref:Rho guanine nucleotide exchange factor, putative n=2 Tax=Entamoeba nuttalli TaxID=412467 RepID=K2GG48_ENTNP|nr:Rho guanine nucleotide exchange factor, putative [Entamoeba nuttalli P19]EKE41656.1 Rho guanine nucleotide exchange factor, putative [Entamoeba nuttalli P19]|eukprot:XP_008856009.1 Rho guanine nucleotide exchange factor, putative [Entamoeba nuttalli P19]
MSFSDIQEQQLIDWVRRHLPEELILNTEKDFRDGVLLIKLCCKITHTKKSTYKHTTNIKGRIQNIESAMKMISDKYGEIEGISVSCIANGNKDQTLSFLNFIKLQRKFEKERRKQQYIKIRKDLKIFEEKTRLMKITTNFSICESSVKDGSVSRKRAFTTRKDGVIQMTGTTLIKQQQNQFRERTMSLLNPIAHSKKNDKRITLESSHPSQLLQSSSGCVIEQLAMTLPSRPKTGFGTPAKKKSRVIAVRNGNIERKRASSVAVCQIKSEKNILKKEELKQKESSSFKKEEELKTIKEIDKEIDKEIEIRSKDDNSINENVNENKTPEISEEEQFSELDNSGDEKEIDRCDSITIPNIENIPKNNTEDIIGSNYSSNISSPRSDNEEETFIEFDEKEDQDLLKCIVKRTSEEETNKVEEEIKEISKNIFLMNGIYYIVTDIIDGENILQPLDLSETTLICFIQSTFRSKLLINEYKQKLIEQKQHLHNIQKLIKEKEENVIKIQSIIRGYQFRSSKMYQRMKNLKFAVREILESEKKYLNDLNIIKQMIDKTQELLPKIDIVNQAKLVNETMINCNQLLFKNLEDIIKKDSYGKQIYSAFNVFIKYLSYYTTYMNIYFPLKTFYESDNNTIKSLVKKLSKEFLQNTPPDNYLIRPIQRPPRYKLLLGAVRDSLPSWWNEEDLELKNCISKIREAIFHLNSCMKKNTDQKAVNDLFSKLSFPKKFQPSKDVQRKIVHQGFLIRKTKKLEEFCCFLLNDYFLMTKVKREEVGDIPSENLKNKTKVYHVIDLRQVTLMDVPNDVTTFCINIPEKCFILQAESEEDKITWMHEIDGIFSLQQQKLISRIENLQYQLKSIDIEAFNKTEFLIHPEYEDTIQYFNQTTNSWEEFYMMLHGNVVCLFVSGESAATLQPPILVFDILQLKFKGLLISTRKYSFEMNYKNYTYIFATENNHCKFVWLFLLRNAFYKNCRMVLDLHEFNVNEFNINLLKTWTSFDDIPPSDDENYKYLRMLLLQPHNQICTDCSERQSSYVDLDYGVFICDLCASLHTTCNHTKQSYNPVITFSECLNVPFEALAKLHEYGNMRGTILYTKKASETTYRPSKKEINSNETLRKRWTFAKYAQPRSSVFDF